MKVIENYAEVIAKTTGMVRDDAVQGMAQQNGLHVLDVTWEDTARFDTEGLLAEIVGWANNETDKSLEIDDVCKTLRISRSTFYRYVGLE